MAVYLFDEKRWYEYNPDDYASLIKGAVTDLIVLVYGSVHGGAIGWKSRFIDSMDGPLNPYSKVYDIHSTENDFRNFEMVKSYKEFMHAPPLPIKHLPLAAWLGWHLWVHMNPKNKLLM